MPNMTGRPGHRTTEMNGGSSASYLALTPCVLLFFSTTLFTRGGNRRAFRLPGEGGDHFHCTVEPSPGHVRCRSEVCAIQIPCSRSPKAGHNKAGRSDVRNQRFEPDTGKMQKMREVPLTLEKLGSEEISQNKKRGKRGKCGKCG